MSMEIRNPEVEIRNDPEVRSPKRPTAAMARRRSAELHSAVSQICNLRRSPSSEAPGNVERIAECNSAIQQIENLRYSTDGASRQALLHLQPCGTAQRRAFTGLF